MELAFTDASVDVAEGPGRDPARLVEQLAGLQEALGVPVVRMHQVHGAGVSVVTSPTSPVPSADALVTDVPGVALMTRAADCVPVVLADVPRGVVGAVHSGRAGVEAGVVPAAVSRMRDLGAEDLQAWVGPHVCGACYEVPASMRAEVASAVPQTWAETAWGTPSLDLGAGVVAQLEAEGVAHELVGGCTLEDQSLWSHRRDGERAGRLAGLVWVTA
ncbi:MAG: polyphenol oxidase family protein [Nocardioides sp.]|uniref:polyphenol oxidase family protein n=1 Tax=Nocardioides sp. TaxID=35761 RepID=UPI003F0D0070